MGACQAEWHKNHARPIPSSSSSSSKAHDTKLCKSLSEIIPLVNFSFSASGRRTSVAAQFSLQPHPRTVSRRSLLFSFLGLLSRTASFLPKPRRFVDCARQCNTIPVETECITLVTDKLDAVRLRIVILDELSNWPQQGILVQFSIVSPGSDNVMYMLLPTRSSNIFTMFPRHSPLPFVTLSASAELNS